MLPNAGVVGGPCLIAQMIKSAIELYLTHIRLVGKFCSPGIYAYDLQPLRQPYDKKVAEMLASHLGRRYQQREVMHDLSAVPMFSSLTLPRGSQVRYNGMCMVYASTVCHGRVLSEVLLPKIKTGNNGLRGKCGSTRALASRAHSRGCISLMCLPSTSIVFSSTKEITAHSPSVRDLLHNMSNASRTSRQDPRGWRRSRKPREPQPHRPSRK